MCVTLVVLLCLITYQITVLRNAWFAVQFAEQGQRYVCLVKKEWTTKETFNLGSGTSFSLRGFQGDYEVLVKRGGVPVQRQLFTLGKQAAVWNLAVTDSTGKKNVTVNGSEYSNQTAGW